MPSHHAARSRIGYRNTLRLRPVIQTVRGGCGWSNPVGRAFRVRAPHRIRRLEPPEHHRLGEPVMSGFTIRRTTSLAKGNHD